MPARLFWLGALALVASALIGAPAAYAAGAPQIADSWAESVSTTGVELHAEVNPEEAQTTVEVQYLLATAYQANLNANPPRDGFSGAVVSPLGGEPIGSGVTAVPFFLHIGGLKPNSAYRYRIVAINAEGETPGPPRAFTTRPTTSGTFSLPDGRGWEMVSPVDKNGGEIPVPGTLFGGGVWQAATAGSAVTYSSAFSFAGGQGSPGASQYISRRNTGGWTTENVSTATLAGAYGTDPDGVPFQLFSGDLSRGLVFNPSRCEAGPCLRDYLLRQSSNGSLAVSPQESDMALAGASVDLTQVVLSTCAALTADATEAPGVGGCDTSKPNLYRWSGGALTLVNLLPGDTQGTPGAALGAQSGAVSSDGSRVYFAEAGNLYLRNGSQTVQVDESLGGGGTFQTATPDGSVAFFTKAEHLYRYVASTGVATDLTPGGGVQGVLGSSPDGAYLYYLSTGGLFLDHNGTTTKVAATADASNYPPASGTARIAAGGNLAFLSTTTLTEVDGGGFSQVYLYAPGSTTLTCASCNPSGARPIGPSSIPGAVANGKLPSATRIYKPRVLSASGNRLFFDSADAIGGTDTNNDRDVYQWEAQGSGSCTTSGGCVGLISSGRAEGGATFLDASADGSDVFFVTDGSLVLSDPGAADVYDARIGGGFPAPPVPIVCTADACQVLPGEPDNPASGTGFYRPEGNPALVYPKAKHPKPKKHKKHHHKKHHGKGDKRAGAKQGGRS